MDKEFLQVLKQRNREDRVITTLIGTIIGETERKTKTPSEQEIYAVMRKIHESNTEIMSEVQNYASKNNFECIEDCDKYYNFNCAYKENEFLDKYLPKKLEQEELENILEALLISGNDMKLIMFYMKEKYDGLYDGKVVVDYIKNFKK